MNYAIITKEEATALKMKPLTVADPADSPFISNVCKDMERVHGTIWAPVDAGAGRVEIWRVPLVPVESDDD